MLAAIIKRPVKLKQEPNVSRMAGAMKMSGLILFTAWLRAAYGSLISLKDSIGRRIDSPANFNRFIMRGCLNSVRTQSGTWLLTVCLGSQISISIVLANIVVKDPPRIMHAITPSLYELLYESVSGAFCLVSFSTSVSSFTSSVSFSTSFSSSSGISSIIPKPC